MAAYDPAPTTMAQMDPVGKVPLSFTRDNVGAYQYACQILFNKDPIMHCSFYLVLESNGLQDDILCIEELYVDMIHTLAPFIDPATNATYTLDDSDIEILCAWKEYLLTRIQKYLILTSCSCFKDKRVSKLSGSYRIP